MEPSHESVRSAVEATGDPELVALTDQPESYVLRPAAIASEAFEIFNLVLVEVGHAMGFVIASDPATGEALVTSGQPRAVKAVIAADPTLAEPAVVWDLVRDPPLDGELVDARRTATGYEFHVRDLCNDAMQRMALELDGEPPTFSAAG